MSDVTVEDKDGKNELHALRTTAKYCSLSFIAAVVAVVSVADQDNPGKAEISQGSRAAKWVMRRQW